MCPCPVTGIKFDGAAIGGRAVGPRSDDSLNARIALVETRRIELDFEDAGPTCLARTFESSGNCTAAAAEDCRSACQVGARRGNRKSARIPARLLASTFEQQHLGPVDYTSKKRMQRAGLDNTSTHHQGCCAASAAAPTPVTGDCARQCAHAR